MDKQREIEREDRVRVASDPRSAEHIDWLWATSGRDIATGAFILEKTRHLLALSNRSIESA